MAIGVIIPVLTPAPYLVEALAAVLAQERAPDAVVVVDDGSRPSLRLPEGLDDRVRLVRRDERGGPAAARATGLEATAAELIALADADDVWLPGKLAAQLDALAEHPDAAVCFGRAEVVDERGGPTGERWRELTPGVHDAASLRRVLFESNPIPAASVVLRRGPLMEVGGFASGAPLPAASDWELWLRLVAAGHSFVYEPRAVVRYRRHRGGVTHDVAALAEAGLAIHERHAGLADEATRREVRARELTALAHGRIRERRYSDARAALHEAAELRPPSARDRALSAAAALPGVRAMLGRRDPYLQRWPW